MSTHLGRVARELREAAGVMQLDIATRAGVDHSTISLFETGLSRAQDGEPRWRRDTDVIVQAYAAELGMEASDIWQAALDSYRASQS